MKYTLGHAQQGTTKIDTIILKIRKINIISFHIFIELNIYWLNHIYCQSIVDITEGSTDNYIYWDSIVNDAEGSTDKNLPQFSKSFFVICF